MRRLMPSIGLILTGLVQTLAVPSTALAFECTNAGEGSTAPNDNGGGSRSACDDGADASGAGSTAVGRSAAASGNFNTTLGYDADAESPHTNATAIGYLAQVEQSHALVLGSMTRRGGRQIPLALAK